MKTRLLSFLLLCFAFLLSGEALQASNVRFLGAPTIKQNGSANNGWIQFGIAWDNSWRTNQPANYDAVWIFAKYSFGDSWYPVWFTGGTTSSASHSGAGNPSSIASGTGVTNGSYQTRNAAVNTDDLGTILNVNADRSVILERGLSNVRLSNGTLASRNVGMLIYRGANGLGAMRLNNVCLHWDYSNAMVPVLPDDVFTVRVFAIEMVYVATGPFDLGGLGTERNQFLDRGRAGAPANAPYRVANENAIAWQPMTNAGLGMLMVTTRPPNLAFSYYFSANVVNQTNQGAILTRAQTGGVRHAAFWGMGNVIAYHHLKGFYRMYTEFSSNAQNNPLDQREDGYGGTTSWTINAATATNNNSWWYNSATRIHIRTSPNYTISAAFPKGYNAFWIMKHEVTTASYADFLNSLDANQQAQHVQQNATGATGAEAFASGRSNRNGIVIKEAGSPAVFGVQLVAGKAIDATTTINFYPGRQDTVFDNGHYIAHNYARWYDVLAYLDWAGLRPMTEMEYEKACRGFVSGAISKTAVAGEYAWGTNTIVSGNSILNSGGAWERINSTTAYATSTVPVRVGIFADTTTTRVRAGASYWGVMNLSDNVREPCVSLDYFTASAAAAVSANPPGTGWSANANVGPQLFQAWHGCGMLNSDGGASGDICMFHGWPLTPTVPNTGTPAFAGGRFALWTLRGAIYTTGRAAQDWATGRVSHRHDFGNRVNYQNPRQWLVSPDAGGVGLGVPLTQSGSPQYGIRGVRTQFAGA